MLILTHDLDVQIDRRIINIAKELTKLNYNIEIICLTEKQVGFTFLLDNCFKTYAISVNEIEKHQDPIWLNQKQLTIGSAIITIKRKIIYFFKENASWFYFILQALYRFKNQLLENLRARKISWKSMLTSTLNSKDLPQSYGLAHRDLNDEEVEVIRRVSLGASDEIELPNEGFSSFYPLYLTTTYFKFGSKLDFSHIMACDLPQLPAAAELAKLKSAKLIFDAHELYPYQKEFTPRQKMILAYYEAKYLPQVDLFLTIADTTVPIYLDKYKNIKVPLVITNATQFDQRSDLTLKKYLGLSSDSKVLLFHGSLSKGRNLENMILGFKELKTKNTFLVLLGFGNKKSLMKLAGNDSRIKFVDAVKQEELPSWILDSDAVIIPYLAMDLNTRGAFPNKLGDCLALKVPVIANEELIFIKNLSQRFNISYVGNMGSSKEMEQTLAGALEWLENSQGKMNFDDANDLYGWPAQVEKLRQAFSDL